MKAILDIEPLLKSYDVGQEVMNHGLSASVIIHKDEEVVVALIHPKLWQFINLTLEKEVGLTVDPRSHWDGKTDMEKGDGG